MAQKRLRASALDGDEWSTLHPGGFNPGKESRYALVRPLGGPQSRSGRCKLYVISGLRRDVYEIYVLRYYAALSGSSVPTFRNNLSVPSSRVKKSKPKVCVCVCSKITA